MKAFGELASDEVISKVVEGLKLNGVEAFVVDSGEEAKKKIFQLLPKGSEIMVMTSETLRTLGIEQEINSSPDFVALKLKIAGLGDDKTREKKQIGAAPEVAIGSVHAVTEDGSILIASNTGSQLPAYAYGADKVIWVVGAQKLVKDAEEGKKRLYEYVLPLESARARKAYNLPETWHSNVSKLLFFNKELVEDRVKIVIVKEVLGF